jgi:hypothetical protein
MKRINIALLCLYSLAYGEEAKFLGRIVQQAKIPKEIITKERLAQDKAERFNKNFITFSAVYKPTYSLLENLNEALTHYNNQPLEYQRHYSNITHIDALINQLQQKELTIALTRLLQYKTSNKDNQQALEMINNLKKVIATIETTLKKLSSDQQLLIQFSDSTPEKIAHITVADYFKHYLGKQLFFKIKKIKRALSNWDHRQ